MPQFTALALHILPICVRQISSVEQSVYTHPSITEEPHEGPMRWSPHNRPQGGAHLGCDQAACSPFQGEEETVDSGFQNFSLESLLQVPTARRQMALPSLLTHGMTSRATASNNPATCAEVVPVEGLLFRFAACCELSPLLQLLGPHC